MGCCSGNEKEEDEQKGLLVVNEVPMVNDNQYGHNNPQFVLKSPETSLGRPKPESPRLTINANNDPNNNKRRDSRKLETPVVNIENKNNKNSLATLLNAKTVPSYPNRSNNKSESGGNLAFSSNESNYPLSIIDTYTSQRLDYIVTRAQQEFLNIEQNEATSPDSIEDRLSYYQTSSVNNWVECPLDASNYDIVSTISKRLKIPDFNGSEISASDLELISEFSEKIIANFQSMHVAPYPDGPFFVDLLEGMNL